METEYISRKELIVWLMPYLHFGELVDPEVLFADIRAMKGAEVASEESLMREMERTGEASRVGGELERQLMDFAEEVIRQFAYRIKTNGQCAYTAGGLSVLEEAFGIVGWADPHLCPECECEEDGCHEWATGGMLTPDGYKWLCGRHREVYQAREEAERERKED